MRTIDLGPLPSRSFAVLAGDDNYGLRKSRSMGMSGASAGGMG